MEIRAERAKISGSPDKPAPAHAFILHQLKHPDEIDLLRQIYGASFLLIAGHAPRRQRNEELQRRMALKASQAGKEDQFEAKASDVIRIDEKQEDDFGQNVRDTYPKADFFANMGIDKGEQKVRRFVDLLFGHPFHTPTPDEYAMYQANAVSLRSSDDNRQVGAVIVSHTRDNTKIRNTDIIAVGMNEVPRGGGGFYWDQDSPDNRDQSLLMQQQNRAANIKISVLTELIDKIIQKKWLQEIIAIEPARDLADSLLKELKGTQFLDIGEFSRPVHAEMTALIDAARRGVAVDGHSMYVTTFPCHNCAKHIIAAGIQRVVYLEPYPKSRARDLYREEITLESLQGKEEEGKVVFFAYTGVAPRQYQQLFSMSERGAKKRNSLTKWTAERRSLSPLYVPHNASLLSLAAERQELVSLPHDIYSKSGS
ncbi:MAG: dCMP deaminase family protein [Deltaproteobacteria bacterium]|nr:dCMP deaminase family protein [Deltaproteobacteria bacterium]